MLEVLKNGQIVSTLDISTQTHYIFGRLKSLDFPMNHQSMSRRHAVLQFRDNASLYLYDLDSTHGTFINKRRIPPHTYAEVKIGDLLSFGASTRKYILEGPASLRPQERKRVPMLINAEATQVEAPTHFTWADDVDDEDGATWGVGSASERAIEDDEKKEEERKNRDFDKGSATSDRQKKLLERMELRDRKMTNITKEMENLRSKEQSQAGLTEGQQARLQQCEERITALMEQRGDLVETINDSMEDKERRNAGMAGAIKKKNGRTRYSDSDEEDDFYDRTQNAAKKAVVVKKEIAVVPIKKNADTVAVARAAVKVAEMELENATSRVFKLELQLRDFATAKSKGEDADSLDSFMASITDTVKKDKRRDIEHEIKDLSERKALLAPLIVERKAALVRAEYASAGTDEAVKQLIERHKKEHEAEKAKRQREATAVAAKAKKDSGEAVDSKDAGAAGVRAKAVGTGVEQDPKEKAVKEASKTTDVGGTMAYLQLGKKRAEERKRKEEEEENKALGMVEQERVENEKKRNKFIDGFSASVEGGSKEPEDDPLERIRSALEAQRHRGRKEGQEDAFTAAQKRKTAQLSRLEGNDGEV
jgi:pSer/pThr/pTyr-binding forkhead associated (FHA) protein